MSDECKRCGSVGEYGCYECTAPSPTTVRLRRKLEILRLDLKVKNDHKYHDVKECLSLLDIIEKDRGP